jgi:uncharacterized membrane protein
MDASFREILDLITRWIHLIAGIMWVGNSLLFNWLDRNLETTPGRRKEHLGRIWLLHSGAFYDVEKTMLAPGEMPKVLHWFKWQSYTTWLSGVALLYIVYYMGDGSYLVMAGGPVKVEAAKDIGIGLLILSVLAYEIVWRILGNRLPELAMFISLGSLIGITYFACQVFAGRAAFIHVGAVLGSCMAGNVFFHIMPSQRELVAATTSGRAQDPSYSIRAKQRSIHNNYMTFPLLLIMLSNHFPAVYGHKHAWLVLLTLLAVGAMVRHVLNIRFHFKAWVPALVSTIAFGVIALFYFVASPRNSGASSSQVGEKIAFVRVHLVIRERCVPCHAEQPTDSTYARAPKGVLLETPAQIKAYAEQIKVQAVISRAMPQGNKTGITEAERTLLGQWILGGANLD